MRSSRSSEWRGADQSAHSGGKTKSKTLPAEASSQAPSEGKEEAGKAGDKRPELAPSALALLWAAVPALGTVYYREQFLDGGGGLRERAGRGERPGP